MEIVPWTWEVQFGAEVDPHGNTAAYLLYQQGNNSQRGLIRDLATARERALPVALRNPRWSRDGSLLAGDRDGAIYMCAMPSADRCEELTDGLRPTFSSDGARLYFLRRTSPTMADLWLFDRAAKQERRLRSLGPFRPFDVFFDVGPMDRIVWAQYEEGRHEIWIAELR